MSSDRESNVGAGLLPRYLAKWKPKIPWPRASYPTKKPYDNGMPPQFSCYHCCIKKCILIISNCTTLLWEWKILNKTQCQWQLLLIVFLCHKWLSGKFLCLLYLCAIRDSNGKFLCSLHLCAKYESDVVSDSTLFLSELVIPLLLQKVSGSWLGSDYSQWWTFFQLWTGFC